MHNSFAWHLNWLQMIVATRILLVLLKALGTTPFPTVLNLEHLHQLLCGQHCMVLDWSWVEQSTPHISPSEILWMLLFLGLGFSLKR